MSVSQQSLREDPPRELGRFVKFKTRIKKTRNILARKIWEHDYQRNVILVTNVTNVALVILLGTLTFSPSWPLGWTIAGWITALCLALFLVAGAVINHDLLRTEKSERLKAVEAAERFKGDISTLEDKLQLSVHELTSNNTKLTEARQMFSDYDRAIKGALLPLAGILEKIPLSRTSKDAMGLLGEFKSMALTMLHRTAGTSQQQHAARATLYEIDAKSDLLYQNHAGRAELPRERFEGESLVKIKQLIDEGSTNWFAVDDPKNCVKPSKGSTYKVVVATSVGRRTPKHGMLTIDSTDMAQLSDEDWPILQSVGSMLAASYRIVALVEELEAAEATAVENDHAH